ncbi:MAG: hypothetical protein EOO77_07180, partial [Oxalobacteraceae bacterium]
MADLSNDNEPVRPVPGFEGPDAHGQAAMLLVESLIHGMIARSVIQVADAIDVVTAAIDVKMEIEADLGDNGGLLRLWDAQDVERFIAEEQSFWRVIHEGDMSTPFNVVHNHTVQMGEALRSAVEKRDQHAGNAALATYYGVPTNRIPLS